MNFTKVQDVLQGIQSLLADLMKTCKLKIPPFRNLIIYQRGCNRIELFRTLSLLQRNVFFILFKDIRFKKKKMNEFQNIFLFNILIKNYLCKFQFEDISLLNNIRKKREEYSQQDI